MDLLDRLVGHDRWTTERLLSYCGNLPTDAWDQEFGIGHVTLRHTFEHFMLARQSWSDLMSGVPGTWMTGHPTPADPLDEFRARNAATSERFEAVARAVIADGRLDDTFIDAYGYEQSYGATIVQVILHAHGHRTEILHILERLGVKDLPDGDPQEWERFLEKSRDAP